MVGAGIVLIAGIVIIGVNCAAYADICVIVAISTATDTIVAIISIIIDMVAPTAATVIIAATARLD
ncbi:MAG: hypothetical protein DHS20C08_00380 [Rhodomicrobium sp.]|nr:MAG: hypothetical protein DHS20C08_00380 [Rhodomicrobium sp.]